MVARGAGAAGPVLLACRQWDPLGLARRLPSLRIGAWCCAPLLPWRVQCPVCVCAALAAGSGGSGPCLASCLFRFPLPAPRVPRCVWRAVPSGCPLPSLAGTPFHAVCAFRALGPVALPVVPACPFPVCALTLSRCPLPPPRWVVWRAHLAWPRHWALVGPFHVVRAPLPVLPRSLAPSGVLGGGRSGPGSPYLAWGCGGGGRASPGGVPSTVAWGVWGHALPLPRLPVHWAGCWGPRSTCCGRGRAGVGALLCPCGGCAPRGGSVAFIRWGAGWGGGGGACAEPPGCAAGAGPVGRGVALPHSVPLPSLGSQQSGRHWCCAVHGGRGPPYDSGSCSRGFSGYDLCGVPVRRRGPAGSSRPPWEPAAGAGGRVALRLPSREGRDHPPCLGGEGRGPRGWRAGGGAGGGGGVAPRPPCSPSGRRPAVLHPGPLRVASAFPSGVRVRSGLKCRPGVGGG